MKKTNSLPTWWFFFLLLKQYFKIKFSESLWHSQQIFPFGSVSYSVSRRIPINLSCIKTWYSNEKGLEKSKLWRSYITTLLAPQWNKLLKIFNCQICKEKQFSGSVGPVLCQLKKKKNIRKGFLPLISCTATNAFQRKAFPWAVHHRTSFSPCYFSKLTFA